MMPEDHDILAFERFGDVQQSLLNHFVLAITCREVPCTSEEKRHCYRLSSTQIFLKPFYVVRELLTVP